MLPHLPLNATVLRAIRPRPLPAPPPRPAWPPPGPAYSPAWPTPTAPPVKGAPRLRPGPGPRRRAGRCHTGLPPIRSGLSPRAWAP